MIALVSGTVAVRRGDHVIIDCGGVGYRLSVSAETLRHVPAVGKQVLLHSHMVVRDDALQLYGFATEEEREGTPRSPAARSTTPRACPTANAVRTLAPK